MNSRILVVEDEENIQHALKLNLELEGYNVVVCGNGNDATRLFREQRFDLVVLDIMLPGMDGITVCENIRLFDGDVPIMFLSAKNAASDKVLGLKKGGDDYLTKPFDLEELLIRVNKLVEKSKRIQHTDIPQVYHFGPNWINFENLEAQGVGGKIALTKKESKLMRMLIENRNNVISREHILKVVWDYTVIPNTRTIDNFVLSLRKYFEDDPKNPRFIRSARGVGYRFVVE